VTFGVVVLLIISGWGLLSIVVSLGLGEIVKTRDRGTKPDSEFLASDGEDLRTTARSGTAEARRSA
jgi:hypothetical protein